jgi:hypothetical protein
MDESPHDFTTPIHPTTNNIYRYMDSFSDDELAQETLNVEEMLEEMRVWDIEDAENEALGRKVPGTKPPAQPYRESDDFKKLTHQMEYMEALRRERIEQDVEGMEEEVLEIVVCSPVQPHFTSPPHHDSDSNVITTPPPDICIPDPLPLSPNIWYKPTHHISAFLIAATKCREPRYYFGSPPRRRRRTLELKTHNSKFNTRTLPPDIREPKPFPPAPNISLQPLLIQHSPHQQPRRPAYTRPRRKHPPTFPLSPDRRHNAIRRILKKTHPYSL